MCGIIYHKSFKGKPINRHIINQYQNQKLRGQEGFGVFDIEHKKIARHPGENHILQWLKSKPSTEILFHHRFPTSTANVKNACHPFSTYDYFGEDQYVLVHNGVVSNEEALRTDHDKLKIQYSSEQPLGEFNDSEALLWDVALYLDGAQPELKARGSISFICFKRSPKGNKLYFGRNHGSPLMMNFNKKRLSLASEGNGKPIKTDTLYTFDYNDHSLTEKPLEIPSGLYVYNGNYNPPSGYVPKPKEWEYEEGYENGYENLDQYSPQYLQTEIKKTVREFMELVGGYYSLAYEMMEDAKQELDQLPHNLANFQEKEILNGAQSVLLDDPFWKDLSAGARDSSYAEVNLTEVPGLHEQAMQLLEAGS